MLPWQHNERRSSLFLLWFLMALSTALHIAVGVAMFIGSKKPLKRLTIDIGSKKAGRPILFMPRSRSSMGAITNVLTRGQTAQTASKNSVPKGPRLGSTTSLDGQPHDTATSSLPSMPQPPANKPAPVKKPSVGKKSAQQAHTAPVEQKAIQQKEATATKSMKQEEAATKKDAPGTITKPVNAKHNVQQKPDRKPQKQDHPQPQIQEAVPQQPAKDTRAQPAPQQQAAEKIAAVPPHIDHEEPIPIAVGVARTENDGTLAEDEYGSVGAEYINAAEERIRSCMIQAIERHWHPVKGIKVGKNGLALITINELGGVDCSIQESSGQLTYDMSFRLAVRHVKPDKATWGTEFSVTF